MKLYIPTYRRTDRQWTFRNLPEAFKKRVVFVCDSEDADALEEVADGTGAVVHVHPKQITSIAKKRAYIIRMAMREKAEKLVMFDDDLRFCIREVEGKKLLRIVNAVPHEVAWALQKLEAKLDKFGHVGIGARGGNNQIFKEQVERNRPLIWWPNARLMYVLGYRVDAIRKCELGRIEHREDFDYNLQMLRMGYENRLLVHVCVDQVYGGRGGAGLQRSVEGSNADAELLAGLHPGLVKVVQKDYLKSTPRKEVICFWKKALASRAQ